MDEGTETQPCPTLQALSVLSALKFAALTANGNLHEPLMSFASNKPRMIGLNTPTMTSEVGLHDVHNALGNNQERRASPSLHGFL